MADEGDDSNGTVYTIRRSQRRKRPRDEWSSTIVLQVRQSRASGDSKQVEVKSRGGQPSHHKKNNVDDNVKFCQAKFCKQCGWQHDDDAKFCVSCGVKRSSAAPSKGVKQSCQKAVEQPVVNLVSPSKAAKMKAKQAADSIKRSFYVVDGSSMTTSL